MWERVAAWRWSLSRNRATGNAMRRFDVVPTSNDVGTTSNQRIASFTLPLSWRPDVILMSWLSRQCHVDIWRRWQGATFWTQVRNVPFCLFISLCLILCSRIFYPQPISLFTCKYIWYLLKYIYYLNSNGISAITFYKFQWHIIWVKPTLKKYNTSKYHLDHRCVGTGYGSQNSQISLAHTLST